MTTLISSQFKEFVENILRIAGVSDAWMPRFTTDDNLRHFMTAVTHKSVSDNNYEVFEFYGDTILNLCIMQWVYDSHPEITSMTWLAKIKALLQSTEIVKEIGMRLGIDRVVVYDKNDAALVKGAVTRGGRISKVYDEIIEDCVEAIFGCIGHVIRALNLKFAVAVEMCKNIIYTYLDEIKPPITNYEYVFDNISRLKEFLDVMKWPFGWIEQKNNDNTVTISLRWWPTYDVKNAHPGVQRDMTQFLNQTRRPLKGNMDARLVNELNTYFRGETSRLLYAEPTRLYQTQVLNEFGRKQFTTYFGIGEELVSVRESLEELEGVKQELAGQALKRLAQTFPNFVPRPPPLQGKSKTAIRTGMHGTKLHPGRGFAPAGDGDWA